MTLHTEHQIQQRALLSEMVDSTLRPNDFELLRHLGQVLGVHADSRVLLIIEEADVAQQRLRDTFACTVEVYNGDLQHLPYEQGVFDTAFVAVPLPRGFHAVARELSRVLKPNGTLGLVAFSVYRDQLPEDAALYEQATSLMATSRPAAAYRAVLAECGFTAFVSEDRRSELRRAAIATFRQHMVHQEAEQHQAEIATPRVLDLMATGMVGLTLITAEKAV